MSLKPRKRDQFLGYVRKRVLRSSSPSIPPSEFHTSTQSLVQPEDVPISSQVHSSQDEPSSIHATRSSPPSPINVPIDHQDTGGRGKIAIQVVKESLKLVARISDVFPPLKTTVAGLVEIFDRIDVSPPPSKFLNIVIGTAGSKECSDRGCTSA